MSPRGVSKQTTTSSTEDAVRKIREQYGDESIGRMGDNFRAQVKRIGSGIPSLDLALGGGFPLGRVVEIFGPESSGKSTLALSVVGEAQKAGLECAYVDSEHAMDPIYAEALGVNIGDLWFSQPDNGEQALSIVDMLCREAGVGVIVVDSVAALTPRAEIEGEMGDAHVGLMARMMSQGLRKLTGPAAKNEVLLVFINQLREKIGVMYGSPEVTPGGRALKFYSSVRLDVRRIETMKTDGEATSNKTRVKVVKNKVAPPFKQAEFEIAFGTGVDKVKDLINVAVDLDVVKKSGSWFSTAGGEQMGQGLNGAKAWLVEHPDELEAIWQKCLEPVAG